MGIRLQCLENVYRQRIIYFHVGFRVLELGDLDTVQPEVYAGSRVNLGHCVPILKETYKISSV